MDNGHTRGIRPPSFLRVEERAADVIAAVTLYQDIPSARRTFWRKARCKSEQPSFLARTLAGIAELARYGVAEADLRRIPLAIGQFIDDLFTGANRPRVDVAALQREVDLEHAENRWALAYATGDRAAATCTAYADALEREATHQLTMARALRWDARTAARAG